MVIHVDERKALLVVIDHLDDGLIHNDIFCRLLPHIKIFPFFCLGQKVIERSVTDSEHNWKTFRKLPSQ